MPFTVHLTAEEEALLNRACRQSSLSEDELIRQSIRELCERLERTPPTAYELGRDLFGAGHLADAPTDPAKHQIWEILHAKHGRLG
jgi:hypothetical protein